MKKTQNGTVHRYVYDNFGRILHDQITALGANVDGAVRKISTSCTLTTKRTSLSTLVWVGGFVLPELVFAENDAPNLNENPLFCRKSTSKFRRLQYGIATIACLRRRHIFLSFRRVFCVAGLACAS
ncbi:MAG: hypothetical protein PHO46_02630 [Thermoguttaceae bacterium]|nr:hypothetical protein [Thermoguttaceae bacterium]